MDLKKSLKSSHCKSNVRRQNPTPPGGQPAQDTHHTLPDLPPERAGETNLLSGFQVQRCNDFKAHLSLFLCTASRASSPISHYYFFQGFYILAFLNSFCFLHHSVLALPFFSSSTALQLLYLSKANLPSSPVP